MWDFRCRRGGRPGPGRSFALSCLGGRPSPWRRRSCSPPCPPRRPLRRAAPRRRRAARPCRPASPSRRARSDSARARCGSPTGSTAGRAGACACASTSWRPGARLPAARLELGEQPTGRTLLYQWTPGAIAAGRYAVRLHAVDKAGRPLRRTARASGRSSVRVEVSAAGRTRAGRACSRSPARGPWAAPMRASAPRATATCTRARTCPRPRARRSSRRRPAASRGAPTRRPARATTSSIRSAGTARDLVFMHLREGSLLVAVGAAVARRAGDRPGRPDRRRRRPAPALRDLACRLEGRPADRPAGRPARLGRPRGACPPDLPVRLPLRRLSGGSRPATVVEWSSASRRPRPAPRRRRPAPCRRPRSPGPAAGVREAFGQLTPGTVLWLQRKAGNTAVGAALAAAPPGQRRRGGREAACRAPRATAGRALPRPDARGAQEALHGRPAPAGRDRERDAAGAAADGHRHRAAHRRRRT